MLTMKTILYSATTAEKQKSMYSNGRRGWNFTEDRTYQFVKNNKEISFEGLIDQYQPASILDYGSGPGYALNKISKKYPNIKTTNYDPFVDGMCDYPTKSSDLVVLYHVIHHVEDEFIDCLIENLFDLCNKYLVIKLFLLSNYRTVEWYLDKLSRFDLENYSVGSPVKPNPEITKFLHGVELEYYTPLYLYYTKS